MRRYGVVSCVVLVISACGGATAPDAAPSTTAVATASTTTMAPVATPTVAACDLVTPEEVAAATGLAVAEVRDDPPVSCVFDLDGSADVFVSVDDGAGRLAGAASLFSAYLEGVDGGDAEMVEGLGSSAVYSPSFRALAVDGGGGRYFAVGVSGGYGALAEPRDVLAALAALAMGRL